MKQKMKPFSQTVASTMEKKVRTVEWPPSAYGHFLTQHLDENGNTTHFTMKGDGRAEETPVTKQSKLSKLTAAIKHILTK